MDDTFTANELALAEELGIDLEDLEPDGDDSLDATIPAEEPE